MSDKDYFNSQGRNAGSTVNTQWYIQKVKFYPII